MFRQEGQKNAVGAFFREGRGELEGFHQGGQNKGAAGGFCQDSGVLSLEGKPTRKTVRFLR